jgi:hypothetical protein
MTFQTREWTSLFPPVAWRVEALQLLGQSFFVQKPETATGAMVQTESFFSRLEKAVPHLIAGASVGILTDRTVHFTSKKRNLV